MVGLAVVLVVGFAIVQTQHFRNERQLTAEAVANSTSAVPVEVVTATSGSNGLPLTLPGATAAWFESAIYARVSGYVGKWSADIGDHVTHGQVLATLETPELDADLLAAKAKLRAAEAAVTLRKAEADFAETTYARWRDSPKGVVSEQEREDKKAQNAAAQANLAAAQANLNVDQAELDRFNSFAQFKQVIAPYDGIITERRIDIGNLVMAGSSGGSTPLYRMAKSDEIRVFVDIPQSAAADLMKQGSPVDIVVGDLGGRKFAGQISRTSQAIDPHARTFRAEIDLPNPDGALLPGMYVDAAFQLTSQGTVQVPASAMLFRSAGPQVAVVDAAQTVHFVAVTIARDDGAVIELSGGVKKDDRVVLNISNQVAEGDAVRITAIDGKPVTKTP